MRKVKINFKNYDMIVWSKRVLKIMFRVRIVQSKKMRNSLEVDASSWQ